MESSLHFITGQKNRLVKEKAKGIVGWWRGTGPPLLLRRRSQPHTTVTTYQARFFRGAAPSGGKSPQPTSLGDVVWTPRFGLTPPTAVYVCGQPAFDWPVCASLQETFGPQGPGARAWVCVAERVWGTRRSRAASWRWQPWWWVTLRGTDENGGRGAGRQAGRPEVGASAGQLPSPRRALSVGLLAASRFFPVSQRRRARRASVGPGGWLLLRFPFLFFH